MKQLNNDAGFHLALQAFMDDMKPESGLRGKDLEVEIYRIACMREGLSKFYEAVLEASEPSLDEDEYVG